ncbi:nuclease-related domain-containing protein [Planococcus sp. 1R117A]|uniref:nuclease-related domain-containing protein n=1 Tax=Planococcus sp. 1R117A TaxID=3447020 RepID=UPI003EDBD2CC
MFMKEREAPVLLEVLPRLMHRLKMEHEDIVSDHYKARAGFGGEQRIDELLKRIRWLEPPVIIGDLQLNERFCQIDTVVLTPHFAVVLEVKNYSGTLSFDEQSFHMKQETRDGKFFGYNSPVTQAWNAREELLILFQRLGILLPVYTAVVLPYSTTLIEKAPKEVPVIYGYSLNRFLSSLPRTGLPMSPQELARAGQLVIDHHTLFPQMNYQDVYRYQVKDLKKGVLCGSCGAVCARKSERVHVCVKCQSDVRDGYFRALDDWFEFVSPVISNAQCWEFLGLKDKHAAGYVLRKMGLASHGDSVQRVYMK